MCIFQIKNALVSLKNDWPPSLPVQNPLDYNVWGVMLGCCQTFTPKPSNIAELKPEDCLAVVH